MLDGAGVSFSVGNVLWRADVFSGFSRPVRVTSISASHVSYDPLRLDLTLSVVGTTIEYDTNMLFADKRRAEFVSRGLRCVP